jgi:predicted transcriptional regulator
METDLSLRLTFGSNLKKFRARKKLTQEKLAELTGIDYKYIQKLVTHPPKVGPVSVIE